MDKKISIVVLLILLFLFSACDNKDKVETNTTPHSSSGEVSGETKIKDGINTKQVKSQPISIENDYKSADLDVSILGVEEYKIIEGKSLKDKAPEGEKYLVAYLAIANHSNKDEYFNYNYLKSSCDGKEIETTYLLNDPKDYKTIFNTVPANGKQQGYLVYKVPEGWQKIEAIYMGWEETKEIKLSFEITSNNLKEVKPFESEFYAPYKGKQGN